MVTLTKALDLQSAPTKHLGDEARANYEQFITNINDDLYEQLAECIRIASSQGALGIDVYYHDAIEDVEREGLAYLKKLETLYSNGLAQVNINVSKLVNWEALAKRLEREKLMVVWNYYEDDGDVIDSVTWINTEE
nr:MAG TPA: hypothetical protein [Caudoviricetes sp.]